MELELQNIQSNSDLMEKHMGEETKWDDNELMDCKEIFIKVSVIYEKKKSTSKYFLEKENEILHANTYAPFSIQTNNPKISYF